jgi:hypothetical protein
MVRIDFREDGMLEFADEQASSIRTDTHVCDYTSSSEIPGR